MNNGKFEYFKRIVIKIGSSTLVEAGSVKEKWLEKFICDVAEIVKKNVEIIIVSSGAIALGKPFFVDCDMSSIQQKQAAAAVGQINLISAWQKKFKEKNLNIAQILLTASDCSSGASFDNLQNTFLEIFKNKIIPIVNENDSVAIDEIKIGDNDRLAALVCNVVGADLLILFSDIDGLYDKNPKIFKDAKFIDEVLEITDEIESMASGAISGLGTGGMTTKIMAAKIAKCDTIVTEGSLKNLFEGGQKFTIFRGANNAISHF